MICPKCSAVIQEGSNFCPNCGKKCFKHVDNREQLQLNSDGKKHCRNCNKEIREGTLCKKYLRQLNQEQLTRDERKLRNDNRDKIGCLCACFGLGPIIIGIIFMFSIDFIVGLIIAG
ncbi:MAG TPA: zinc-ribbon domain-containing protein, partial [Candidatus Scatavimonas merdigallinarum]|nr:zinc-ribbon domain-containing protein [Candidatus Scatavimonas merdigallinarum]